MKLFDEITFLFIDQVNGLHGFIFNGIVENQCRSMVDEVMFNKFQHGRFLDINLFTLDKTKHSVQFRTCAQ